MNWINWCDVLLQKAMDNIPLTNWENFNVDLYQSFVFGGRWKLYLEGLGNTLLIAVMALVLGVILGMLVAVIRTLHDQRRAGARPNVLLSAINWIAKLYTTVIRGTPMMVQLLIMAMVIFKSSRNLVAVSALAFGINSGAYVAEIVRGGLMSVDGGQMEAGRSLGLNYFQTMRFIIIPQAIKNILPALGNELISLLKETSIVGIIGLRDLTKSAQLITTKVFGGFMPLFGVALVYLGIVLILSWLLGKLERRMRQSDRR